MWRDEAGVLEMLFAYISEFEEFSGWTSWRGVIMDILSCHEDARRQRIASVCATMGMGKIKGLCKTEISAGVLGPESPSTSAKVILPSSEGLPDLAGQTGETFCTREFEEVDECENELRPWSGETAVSEHQAIADANKTEVPVDDDDEVKEISVMEVIKSMSGIQLPMNPREGETPIFVKPELPEEVIDVDEIKRTAEQMEIKDIDNDLKDLSAVNVMLEAVKLPFITGESVDPAQLNDQGTPILTQPLRKIQLIPTVPINTIGVVNNLPKLPDPAGASRRVEPRFKPFESLTGTIRMPFRCRFCSKMFSSHTTKIGHEKRHTEDKPFSCSVCAKSFTQISNKIIHERSHTGEKPFRCSFCSKAFTNRSNKVRHERIHTGERPFNCRFCGKAFNQDSSKAAHERIHTGEKPYSCTFCGKMFTDNSGKAKHERRHMMEAIALPPS